MSQLIDRAGAFARFFGKPKAPPQPDMPVPAHPSPHRPAAPVDCAAVAASPKQRVRKAFTEIPLNPREKQAVQALLEAPGSTAPELSAACGWMPTGWRTQMLLLCQRRRRHLWPGEMRSNITNGIIISSLAEYDADSLQFHPRKGLERLLRGAVAAA